MASQLEQRLQQVSGELDKARKNQGLKDAISELEAKLKSSETKVSETESRLKSAQESKIEISEQLSKMIKEKKQAEADAKEAQSKAQLARKSQEIAEAKLIENSDRTGQLYGEIEKFKETIEE